MFAFSVPYFCVVVGAFLMPLFPGCVLTGTGMVLGAAWNVLVAVTMVLLLVEFNFGRV